MSTVAKQLLNPYRSTCVCDQQGAIPTNLCNGKDQPNHVVKGMRALTIKRGFYRTSPCWPRIGVPFL